MTVDYSRAFEITKSVPKEKHNPECSWRVTGYLLCDCDVLCKHPDYLDTEFHSNGGMVVVDKPIT